MNPEDYSYAEAVDLDGYESAKANVIRKIAERLRTGGGVPDSPNSSSSSRDSLENSANNNVASPSSRVAELVSKNPSTASLFADQIAATRWQDAALESSEDEDDDDRSQERRRARRDAFENLRPFVDNIPNDFYRDYHASLRKRLKTTTYADEESMNALDRHMNGDISKAEKYRLLRSLTISLSEGDCDVSIFSNSEPRNWDCLMLLRALIPNDDSWDSLEACELAVEIIALVKYIREDSSPRHCVENVLEFFIRNQRAWALDVETLRIIVRLLFVDPESLDLVIQDISLPTIMERVETLRLSDLCKERGIRFTDESRVAELRGLLGSYSRETVGATIGKVKRGTEITELIDLLRTLNDNELPEKEEFLLNLRPFRNIDIWKRELYFPLIRSFICREFPDYDDWSGLVGNHEARKLVDARYSASSKPEPGKSVRHTRYTEFDEGGRDKLRSSLRHEEAGGLLHAQLFCELNEKLAKLLLKCGWSERTLRGIREWIECLDDGWKLAELVAALDIIIDYDMDMTRTALSALISQSSLANVQRAVHKFAVDDSFPGSHVKGLGALIRELVASNANVSVGPLKSERALRSEYDRVVAASDGTSNVIGSTKKIGDWSVSEIEDWSESFLGYRYISGDFRILRHLVKTGVPNVGLLALQALSLQEKREVTDRVDATSRYEMLAVIRRAMELKSRTKIRDVQLLSMILLLNSEPGTGRLAQINTGEGKTTIIAMTAAFHALKGRQVDVVTSSEILAVEQCEQQSGFYETLRLMAQHNFGSDKAYVADIVYGTNQEFQGDILRDEFKKLGNRHGRKCDVVIVDEVDNMLIDGNDHIVMLTSEMPGMDHLEPILVAIHGQVKQALASTVVERGEDGGLRTYFVYQDDALNDKGEMNEKVVLHYVPVKGTREEFVKKCTDEHVRRLIRAPGRDEKLDKNYPEIKIPKHLRKFVIERQLERWIHMALAAQCNYKEGEDYIIKDGEVTVVDADNTGVLQRNMRLSDGLHQFLQIANGTRMTPERLTTNFLSNVSFFRRYRPSIYGVTGTLGPEATRNLLANTYDVDTVVVPPFKTKQHIELTSIVVEEEDDWYSSIARSCLRKLRNGRACLVIMEYIRETSKLRNVFVEEFSYSADKIRMYTRNDESTVVRNALRSGEIIVTTNIAGRGTDVKVTSEVEGHGGLHVCVTFLPKNARVELQNIGRTARTGNRGTSQFVLRNSETDVRELRRVREERNAVAMRRAEAEIARVTTKDAVFDRFCALIDDITGRNGDTRDIEKKAVEERFAIWLKMNGDKWHGRRDEALGDFEAFRADILRDQSNDRLIENPYMHVLIGNAYVEKKDYTSAIREYTAARDLDRNFAEHAYYNRGYAYLAAYGKNVKGNEAEIDAAVSSFEKARALITEREYGLHYAANASSGEGFSARIRNKLNLYSLQRNIIDLAIGPDVATIEAQLADLRRRRESSDLEPEERTGIDTTIEDLEDQAEEEGVIRAARRRGKDLTVALHEFTACLPEDDDDPKNSPDAYKREIAEFGGNGAIGAVQTSELPPINWSAVFTLLALGLGQMILGGALMVFTLGGGGTIATGLIAEGIKDIVIAVRDGIINRTFSWASWAIEKVISLVVSVTCAGWGAMKDVARTMYAGVRAVPTLFTGAMTQGVKEGWKIVAKKVGIEFAKGIGKSFAEGLLNWGVNKTLIPRIQRAIVERIREPIEDALMNNAHVKTMLQLDKMNGNRHYEDRIRAMGHEILNAGKKKDLIYMAEKTAKGISDKQPRGREADRKVAEAVAAIPELYTFTRKFIEKLNGKIAEKARKDKVDERLSTMLRRQAEGSNGESSNNNDSKEGNPAGLCREFVKIVSSGMISIIKGKWIAPLINEGVKHTANYLNRDIDNAMKERIENYRNRERIIIRED